MKEELRGVGRNKAREIGKERDRERWQEGGEVKGGDKNSAKKRKN